MLQRFNRTEFMAVFERLKSKDYSTVVECYVTQSACYEQMGELKTALGLLEMGEKLLINVVG